MPIFSHNNFQFQYNIQGKGKPLLLIGSATYYKRVFDVSLLQDVQVIFLDHRGFAKSLHKPTTDDYTIEHIIADIESFRRFLGLSKWALFGHSGHAYLALSYAQHYPQHVSQLMLCAASPDLSSHTFMEAEKFWEQDACLSRKQYFNQQIKHLYQDLSNDPEKKMLHICRRMGAKRWYNWDFDEYALWKDVSLSALSFDALWGEAFTHPYWFTADHLYTMPTWLSLGRYDYTYPPQSCWQKFKHHFKDLTITEFPLSGHMPFFEESNSFYKELQSWLCSSSSVLC
tara:strand:+ start:1393 stop:2247 length:855 start_codon:yes stop_codon:yes gene_type:complete